MLKRARDILCVDIQRDAATTVVDFSEQIVASLHESDTWCHDTELNDFTAIVSIFLQLILSFIHEYWLLSQSPVRNCQR